MAKICVTTAAILLFAASWVSAGTFEVLARSATAQPPEPFYLTPGTVVRAQFSTNMRTQSDVAPESDGLVPEPVSAEKPSRAKPKPAVAFKERPAREMAPPPKASPRSDARAAAAAQPDEETIDLEADLEKDLVLTPPPARTEEAVDVKSRPKIESRPAVEKAATERKADKKKAAPVVKKPTPSDYGFFAGSPKPVQKVRPVTQNAWMRPAGAHRPAPCPVDGDCGVSMPGFEGRGVYQQGPPPYMSSAPRTNMLPPTAPTRVVRDGVAIRLAPAAAPVSPVDIPDESSGSDIFSTAAEVLGLPFAFISSFF
jgi:hypothetical protein